MNKIKFTIMVVALSAAIIFNPFVSVGQVEKAKQSMMNIYKAYDSLKYLSFDVEYVYDSDTLQGDFTHDQLKGSYIMNGKRAVYNLGDIDFMQNDSFLIAVYNKEKFMIVSDPQPTSTGALLPMREQLDSLFRSAAANYAVTVTAKKNITVIALVAKDTLQQFNTFLITFDNNNNYLLSLQYSFIGKSDKAISMEDDSNSKKLMATARKKSLRIQFSNYKFDTSSASLYDEKNYIFYENNVCKPSAKYSEFKLYYSKIKK